jgi:hypothetical protein
MPAPIEVSRVEVAEGFVVVAFASVGQSQLSFVLESAAGQSFPITADDARTLVEMWLARK